MAAIITAIVSLLGVIGTAITFAYYVGRFTKRVDNIEDKQKKLEDHSIEIEQIKLLLASKYKDAPQWLTFKHSPRVLTPLAEKVFNDIHGKEFLEKHKQDFFNFIDKKHPKTALQTEEVCVEACINLSSKDYFNYIQDYVYQSPILITADEIKVEVSFIDICYILAIPLRDMYLEAHPELQPKKEIVF